MTGFSRKWIAWALAVLMIFTCCSFSSGEQAVWNCPNCGRMGNTGNFCGGCGEPAPRTQEETASAAGLRMPSADGAPTTMKELAEHADEIIRQSSTWTEETAPQTMDAFPFFPRYFPELFKLINENPPTMAYENNAYRLYLPWQKDMMQDYMPADCNGKCLFNGVYRIGEDPATSFYIGEETPGVLIIELPEGVDIGDVYSISYLYYDYDYEKAPDQWHPYVDIEFGMQDGKLTNEISGTLMNYKDHYFLNWEVVSSGSGNERTYETDVSISTPRSESAPHWYIDMKYDTATGQMTACSVY